MPDDLLLMFRRDEVEDFRAEGTLERLDGKTFNPATGTYGKTWTTIYQGDCTFRPIPTGGRRVEAGDQTVMHRTYELTVPVDVLPRVQDRFTLTSSPDPQAAGTVVTVEDVVKDDWIASRKCICQEAMDHTEAGEGS